MAKKLTVQHNTDLKVLPLKLLVSSIKLALTGSVLLSFAPSVKAASSVLPVPAKTWVKSGIATNKVIGNTLQINQKSDKAILHWDQFNIGAKNQVKFQQPKTTSIALNRIFQNDPSRVLGNISANGQVYLYNTNGFVFGKNSTVNANTLVATALDMTDEVFNNNGITKHFSKTGAPALEGNPDPKTAKILVEQGANIHIGKNGRMILTAPEVTNKGNLQADEHGQIMVIASKDKVYLAENSASADSPKSKDFSGLLVEVGTGGRVDNFGNVLSRQGNVTLAGFAVNQKGRITATTSTKVNGSIRLLARQGLGENSQGNDMQSKETIREDLADGLGTKGKVTFGAGSTTQIVADTADNKAIDEQKQPQSYVQVSAHTVHMQSGSKIIAPAGKVDIEASSNPDTPKNTADHIGNPSQGRIILDNGTKIDVSGSKNLTASVARNIVDVPVQSFELRNSPRQKGGVLQGKTIRVDIRDKTPIVDTGGAEKRIERSVNERLGKGGVVNLTSGGEVVVNPNASINISGGTINYQGDYINTSKLLTDYGAIIDISDANPNEHYQALLGSYKEVHEKWGIIKVWQGGGLFGKGRYEPDYLEGLDAGSLNVFSPRMIWQGDLIAGSVSGLFQRNPESRAFGGAFKVNDDMSDKGFVSKQNIVFQKTEDSLNKSSTTQLNDAEVSKLADLIFSTDMLNRSGIQVFNVKSTGNATIAADANITLTPGKTGTDRGTQFDLVAKDIDVKGKLNLPGGEIRLGSAFDFGLSEGSTSPFGNLSGNLTLGSSALLNTSGRWVNDFALGLSSLPTEVLNIDGGNVTLVSMGDMNLYKGSAIHADGGAWLAQNEELTAGDAGLISIKSVDSVNQPNPKIILDAELTAYGINQGGKLAINVAKDEFIVGNQSDVRRQDKSVFGIGVKDKALNLTGVEGFSGIELANSKSSMTLLPKTKLNLVQQNVVLDSLYRQYASSDNITGLSKPTTLPEYLRNPVDLKLSANTQLNVAAESEIHGDKQAKINIETSPQGSVYVDGLLSAPSGEINVGIRNQSGSLSGNYSTQVVWLGTNANLLANGATRLNPMDSLSRKTGDVLDGGNVNLKATSGYLVLEQGSKIDVSGTNTDLDILSEDRGGVRTARTEVGSNAGHISLRAAEGIVLDGELIGKSGLKTNKGGRLDVALNREERLSTDFFPAPRGGLALNIRQDFQKTLDPSLKFGDNLDEHDLGLNGKAIVSSDRITQGGFDDLRLSLVNGNTVNDGQSFAGTDQDSFLNFNGDIDLTAARRIDIDAPVINWIDKDGTNKGIVNLKTAYLKLGKVRVDPNEMLGSPTMGNGILSASTQWTEFNNYSQWNGFNKLKFNSQFDIRAIGPVPVSSGTAQPSGEMASAGNINLYANQIYPSALSKFAFSVDATANPNGQIAIANSESSKATPLSVGGELTFNAPVINQNGTVKAPFGKVNLIAGRTLTLGKGSLTSVSGDGQIIPFGNLSAGQNWVYDPQGIGLLIKSPPEKKLTLSAPAISLEKGSTVDLSGGGDLYAYEFQPGIGGSSDYLGDYLPSDGTAPNYQGGFAIVPKLSSSLAPFDYAQDRLSNYKTDIGSQVYLNGSDKLAAGSYTILPSHYALLPGAFLVTPQKGTQDQRVTTFNQAGLPIVGGFQHLAGSNIRDSRWSGFLIEDGKDVRLHSQYEEVTANNFFTQRAARKEIPVPVLPKDSGQLVIKDVQTKLSLAGDLKVDSKGGRGAKLDIAAQKLNVVNRLTSNPLSGALELSANDLTKLGVGSLLLGGERSSNPDTGVTNLQITSDEVSFDKGANVHVTDLIAAATHKVTVKSGANLVAKGSVNTGDKVLNIAGNQDGGNSTDGALLRLSSDRQVTLRRASSLGIAGDLHIEKGATLSANKSMLLDASHSTSIAGNLQMQGGSLNLSGNKVNLGEVDQLSASDSLNLSNSDLAKLSIDELILTSRGNIGFYGNVGLKDSKNKFNPLTFDRLVINTPGFSGFANGNQTASLHAKNLLVHNESDNNLTTAGTGSGHLSLSADSYSQGNGGFSISGFRSVNIDARKDFTAAGDSKLNIGSNFQLNAGYLTAQSGKTLEVDAIGYQVRLGNNDNVAIPEIDHFGGALKFTANQVNFNSKAILPSGKLGLHSLAGNVEVGAQAQIDLSGRKVHFGDMFDYTPGGKFIVEADHGMINLAKGSNINLNSGGGKAKGGLLDLKAIEKNIELSGELAAQGGSVKLDVAGFSPTSGFDFMMKKFHGASISDALSIRSRKSDISVGAKTIAKVNSIKLISDQGAVSISGELFSDDIKRGGSIEIYAGDKINLQKGSLLSAKGIGKSAEGGKVLLTSTDSDDDRNSGIQVNHDASIDVSGSGSHGGKVVLRALRTEIDSNGVGHNVAIQPIAPSVVKGHPEIYADGVKKYKNIDIGNDGEINSTDIAKLKTDTGNFMTATTMNKVNSLGNGIRLRPGLEINYTGDLELRDEWDFADWRYAESPAKQAVPGVLAINATGNFTIKNSLTDGFSSETKIINQPYFDESGNSVVDEFGAPKTLPVSLSKDVLRTDNSWSYLLTAGADLNAADKRLTNLENKSLTITAKSNANQINPLDQKLDLLTTVVRTGTGDINLSASGNIVFDGGSVKDQSGAPILNPVLVPQPDSVTGIPSLRPFSFNTAVYTAGKSQAGNAYGSFSDDYVKTNYGYDSSRSFAIGEHPTLGGDLFLFANHDIQGSGTQVAFQDVAAPWLVKQGRLTNLETGETAIPTAWGIDFAKFSLNAGAFGGGNANIQAENNIDDFGVAMPTNGKAIGNNIFDSNAASFTSVDNKLQIHGGGRINVNSGSDINGGVFLLGQGKGEITAGGAIRGSKSVKDEAAPGLIKNLNRGPQLLLGDSEVNLFANKGIALSAVSDPMILGKNSSFFSYSPKSAISTHALSGNITLASEASVIGTGAPAATFLNYYPGTLNSTAFGGSILLDGALKLFPSGEGNLNFLAKEKIAPYSEAVASSTELVMSDTEAGFLPNVLKPAQPSSLAEPALEQIHSLTPVHLGDQNPVRLITQNGNIENLSFDLSKKAFLASGLDLKNIRLAIQHVNPQGDVSVITAARDVSYPIPDEVALSTNDRSIKVAGSGDVLIKAGRNIDLGTSGGISTLGDGSALDSSPGNPNLQSSGANLTLLTGLNGSQPNYLGLENLDEDILKYAENYNKYLSLITEFMQNRTGNTRMTTKTAFEQFKQLNTSQYASLKPKFDALVSSKYTGILKNMRHEVVQFIRQRQNNIKLSEADCIKIFNSLTFEQSAAIQGRFGTLTNQILFNELNQTGSASADDSFAGNERGFKAIELIYPGNDWKGDLNLVFSTLQTLKDGNVNLLVPRGNINVGLPVAGVSKIDNELGIIARGKGSINAFLDGDFNVNQSRVFALGGDDIMVWSSHGDIDAGRGAKSALAVSDPVYNFDDKGNLDVDFPPPVAGSGIRTVGKGNVGLYALGGIVNAGEAGIGGNNVTIFATAVLGANNIDVGGVSTGVPVTLAVSLAAGLTGVSNVAANATKMAEASANSDKDKSDEDKQNKKNKLGAIQVELIGFGA